MTRRGFSEAGALLHHLLDRHEASAGATRPTAAINVNAFASVADRDAFDAELARLELAGAVQVVRKGPRFDRHATSVRLADASTAYAHAVRRPSSDDVDAALAGLRSDRQLAVGERALLDDIAAAWRRGVSGLGLAPGDVTNLRHVVLLARALRPRATGPDVGFTDYRTFSRHAAGDSKALERNLRQVAAALTRTGGNPEDRGRSPEELLETLGVTRLPQPVLAGGPLATEHGPLPALAFLGVPPEDAGSLTLTARPSYVLSVENYTSFVRHAREIGRTDGNLTIYSGGFPSRAVLAAITSLAGQAGAPMFHWSDMDGGGVRIFRHLEVALSGAGVALRPHLMSAGLLRKHGRPEARRRLELPADVELSAIRELATFMAESGLVHEQEELDPASPLRCSVPAFGGSG